MIPISGFRGSPSARVLRSVHISLCTLWLIFPKLCGLYRAGCISTQKTQHHLGYPYMQERKRSRCRAVSLLNGVPSSIRGYRAFDILSRLTQKLSLLLLLGILSLLGTQIVLFATSATNSFPHSAPPALLLFLSFFLLGLVG
jgi:hypothetical protein